MQTLTRIDKVTIEDYYYMIMMIDENVNWMKLTHLLSIFSLHLRYNYCPTLYTLAILNVHTKEM